MSTATEHPREGSACPATDWHKAIPLLILVGMIVYFNSLSGLFQFDDVQWISNNSNLRTPLTYLHEFGGRWLVGVSILLNYQVGGLSVTGYHLLNVAAHICAALVLFGIVRRTLALERWQGRFDRSGPWLALAVALIWMVHPLQTQSVTYVIQRCESFMGLFYLLTLYCVLRGATVPAGTRAWPWYVLAVVSCYLGTACKEVMVTAFLVVFLFDWVFLSRSLGEILRRRWGLYLGLALACGTLLGGAVLGLANPTRADAGFGVKKMTPLEYAMTQAGVLLYYLRLSFWPRPLCLDYQGWPITRSLVGALPSALPVLLLLLATGIGLLYRSWLGFLGAWFFLILSVTSSIVPIIDVAFEHRMYLSLAAVVVLVVIGGHVLLERSFHRFRWPGSVSAGLQTALVAGCVAILSVLTMMRNQDYNSSVAIWTGVVELWPAAPRGHSTLGALLMGDEQRVEVARFHTEEALRIFPNDPVSLSNRALLWLREGQLEQAAEAYRAALRSEPGRPVALLGLGRTLLLQGRPDEAVKVLRRAVEVSPQRAMDRAYLATALHEAGFRDEAAAEFKESKRLEPRWPQGALRQVWRIVLDDEQSRASIQDALLLAKLVALASDNQDPEALDALAIAQAAVGQFPEAVATAEQALKNAETLGDSARAERIRERLPFFKANKAFGRPMPDKQE